MDQRKSELAAWARQFLEVTAGTGSIEVEVETVSGDASFRRYFRIRVSSILSYVLVDAPPTHENCRLFVHVARMFRHAGLLTPQVLSVDYEQGFMLLEDFGDTLFLPGLLAAQEKGESMSVDTLYGSAMRSLIELQANGEKGELALYDRKLLRTELGLFDHWFCERFLELDLSAQERAMLDRTWTFLEDAALQQTQACVHRDYHSRNLMVLNDDASHAPGVIDFQDAVVGACTYDLVSLLRDCYIVWPAEQVRIWALQFREMALARGIFVDDERASEEAFLRDFDFMGLQRHIKVIGIFSRLNLRDGKPRYMADIPLVIDYVTSVAVAHPEMNDFMQWFHSKVLPVASAKLKIFMEPELSL